VWGHAVTWGTFVNGVLLCEVRIVVGVFSWGEGLCPACLP